MTKLARINYALAVSFQLSCQCYYICCRPILNPFFLFHYRAVVLVASGWHLVFRLHVKCNHWVTLSFAKTKVRDFRPRPKFNLNG